MNYPIYTKSRLDLYSISPYACIQLFSEYSILTNNLTGLCIKVNIQYEKIKQIINYFDTPNSIYNEMSDESKDDLKPLISELLKYGFIE